MVSVLITSTLGSASFVESEVPLPEFVEFKMPLVDGSTDSVHLPFPYHSITDEERSRLVWVPENFYTVLEETSPLLGAVVGPCSPCSFVAVRHRGLRKTVVMHVHYKFNDAVTVLATLNKEFGQGIKGEDLLVRMFTRGIKDFGVLEITAEEQRARFTAIFNALRTEYNLTSEEQIKALIFQLPCFLNSFYNAVDQSVFVDKDFNLYSVSPVEERVFLRKDVPFDPKNCFALCKRSYERGFEIYRGYLEKYFSDSERVKIPIPVLKRLPDSEMGLEKLPE
jgi:hypothetical protein